MPWIWQQPDWPNFQYDARALQALEDEFLTQAGMLAGVSQHINPQDQNQLTVNLLCDESLNTSEIEGEILNRDSLRSSIRRHLGLGKERHKTTQAEEGISEMMVEIYQNFTKPLSNKTLCDWNRMITRGRWDLNVVGHYRVHKEPMQVVSGNYHNPIVHYEAPPSNSVPAEMNQFIHWYQHSAKGGKNNLPALTKAAIAHLYFVCIHPFEDGNGRIARGLTLKSLSEDIGYAALISLSEIINADKKSYYNALATTNTSIEITDWLIYFANTIVKAQRHTMKIIQFVVAKSKFYHRFQDKLNQRQEKVIARIFRAGVKGFTGGLSAKNYISIVGTSASTATRDLQQLVEMGALLKKGELKASRYFLNLPPNKNHSQLA